jgi:hypothetical protein
VDFALKTTSIFESWRNSRQPLNFYHEKGNTMQKQENSEKSKNNELQLFVQGEGIADIQLVRVAEQSSLRELVGKLGSAFTEAGAVSAADEFIFLLEDSERELVSNKSLKELGIKNRERIHINRCRKVRVSVNFNGKEIADAFPPSRTIAKVKRWADKEFGIEGLTRPNTRSKFAERRSDPTKTLISARLSAALTAKFVSTWRRRNGSKENFNGDAHA